MGIEFKPEKKPEMLRRSRDQFVLTQRAIRRGTFRSVKNRAFRATI